MSTLLKILFAMYRPFLVAMLRAALVIGVLLALAVTVKAADLPVGANQHKRTLVREARALMGMNPPIATMAAQLHQESGWRSNALSPVGARGMAQFMPATASWIATVDPSLKARPGTWGVMQPAWDIRALVVYDRWLLQRVKGRTPCEQWAFALSAYNGGLGWVIRDKRLASAKGADPLVWFGSVEAVNAGRSKAAWTENRGYPQRILKRHEPRYIAAGFGAGVCA